jgi:hypothetical protein
VSRVEPGLLESSPLLMIVLPAPQNRQRSSHKVSTTFAPSAAPRYAWSLTDLTSGGSGGAVYAYIFGWIGTFAIFIVLAELVSMYAFSSFLVPCPSCN